MVTVVSEVVTNTGKVVARGVTEILTVMAVARNLVVVVFVGSLAMRSEEMSLRVVVVVVEY